MTHLKGFPKPKSFAHVSKKWRFTVSPSPGPHPKGRCIPLQIIIRDCLKLANTAQEAQKIIKRGEILVDGRTVKDHRYPVGLFDVVSIPTIRKNYRVVPSGDLLSVTEIEEKEADKKLCRIDDKVVLKKGKIQLNLHDGKNIEGDKKYSTYDSLLVSLPSLEILGHVKKEKSLSVIIGGDNIGQLGTWEDEKTAKSSMRNSVVIKLEGRAIEVPKDIVFPVGKEKPMIKVKA